MPTKSRVSKFCPRLRPESKKVACQNKAVKHFWDHFDNILRIFPSIKQIIFLSYFWTHIFSSIFVNFWPFLDMSTKIERIFTSFTFKNWIQNQSLIWKKIILQKLLNVQKLKKDLDKIWSWIKLGLKIKMDFKMPLLGLKQSRHFATKYLGQTVGFSFKSGFIFISSEFNLDIYVFHLFSFCSSN